MAICKGIAVFLKEKIVLLGVRRLCSVLGGLNMSTLGGWGGRWSILLIKFLCGNLLSVQQKLLKSFKEWNVLSVKSLAHSMILYVVC